MKRRFQPTVISPALRNAPENGRAAAKAPLNVRGFFISGIICADSSINSSAHAVEFSLVFGFGEGDGFFCFESSIIRLWYYYVLEVNL
jgi:hypothetical protein